MDAGGLSLINSRHNGGRRGQRSTWRPSHRDRPPTHRLRESGYAAVDRRYLDCWILCSGSWRSGKTAHSSRIVDHLLRGGRRCDRSGKKGCRAQQSQFRDGYSPQGLVKSARGQACSGLCAASCSTAGSSRYCHACGERLTEKMVQCATWLGCPAFPSCMAGCLLRESGLCFDQVPSDSCPTRGPSAWLARRMTT